MIPTAIKATIFSFLSLYIANQQDAPNELMLVTPEQDRQLVCAAKAIYDEARGEPFDGKVAVAHVIKHRLEKWHTVNSICEVVFHKRRGIYQFSGMGKPNLRYDRESLEIAYGVFVKGKYIDKTGGATFFHAARITPKWSKVYERTATIGNHHFYRSDTVLR
jgi:spore germination cell wall hydrolase CwlJ-like protein